MFTGTGFTEESVERIVTSTDRLVTWHLAIWLNAMLKAEKLPARIPNLHTCLADVDAKSLAHDDEVCCQAALPENLVVACRTERPCDEAVPKLQVHT